MLTGRNHHAVGMGMLPDLAVRFPGYSGRIPRSAATLAALLRDDGYSTFARRQVAPRAARRVERVGPVRPLAARLGFERFYGFLGGDTNQWTPNL